MRKNGYTASFCERMGIRLLSGDENVVKLIMEMVT